MDNIADDRAHINECAYTWHIQFSDNTKCIMPTVAG